jgi:hypothetical protein
MSNRVFLGISEVTQNHRGRGRSNNIVHDALSVQAEHGILAPVQVCLSSIQAGKVLQMHDLFCVKVARDLLVHLSVLGDPLLLGDGLAGICHRLGDPDPAFHHLLWPVAGRTRMKPCGAPYLDCFILFCLVCLIRDCRKSIHFDVF